MNQQILTFSLFIFLLLVVLGVTLIRIARIEWKKLNDNSPITKKHRNKFKGML